LAPKLSGALSTTSIAAELGEPFEVEGWLHKSKGTIPPGGRSNYDLPKHLLEDTPFEDKRPPRTHARQALRSQHFQGGGQQP
jgi:hypothetical protein